MTDRLGWLRWLWVVGACVLVGLARPPLMVQGHGDVKHPGIVHVVVTVEPDSRNRLCRVELTGEIHDRASEFPINGMDGPRTSWIDWREVPSGEYVGNNIVD